MASVPGASARAEPLTPNRRPSGVVTKTRRASQLSSTRSTVNGQGSITSSRRHPPVAAAQAKTRLRRTGDMTRSAQRPDREDQRHIDEAHALTLPRPDGGGPLSLPQRGEGLGDQIRIFLMTLDIPPHERALRHHLQALSPRIIEPCLDDPAADAAAFELRRHDRVGEDDPP